MELLETEVIQKEMLDMYEILEGEIEELNFKNSRLRETDISRMCSNIKIDYLDSEFTRYLMKYDFGELSIGGVTFGFGGDYLDFLCKSNMLEEANYINELWFSSPEERGDLLMIASTDSYIILLNNDTGEIESYLRDSNVESKHVIAKSFSLFVRAAGTFFVSSKLRKEDFDTGAAIELSKLCCADSGSTFWVELCKGIA